MDPGLFLQTESFHPIYLYKFNVTCGDRPKEQ